MKTYYCVCEQASPTQVQCEEAEKLGIIFVALWSVPDDYRNFLLVVDPYGTFCPWHYPGRSVRYFDSVDEAILYIKEKNSQPT